MRAQDAQPKSDPQVSDKVGRIALSLWRARRKTRASKDDKNLRDVGRFLDSAWDALLEAGVEVTDHVGEYVTGGEGFSVLVTEPVGGLTRPQVIETVRPTIYFRGAMIQSGQVIVGRPADSIGGGAL